MGSFYYQIKKISLVLRTLSLEGGAHMLYENTMGKVYTENNFIYVSSAVGRTVIEVYDESDFDYINQVFDSYV